MKSKAAVAKALKDKGIPLPEEDSYDAMMHRLNSWEVGHGWLFRRIKSRFYARKQLPADIPMGTIVWIPNSQFARDMMKTGAMFPMGRSPYKETFTIIDVPKTETYTEPKAEKPKVEKKATPKKKSTPKKKTSSKKVKEDGDNDKSN